jgi:AraC family transcriptional regulator
MKNYITHINRCLKYIEDHLLENLELEEIADRNSYSMFHFHRIFLSITDFTFKEYVRKRRLTKAASEIIFRKDKIIDIAKKYRYETQESFTRAFKREFGITPGKMRTQKTPYRGTDPITLAVKKGESMKAVIIYLEEIEVMGLKCVTTQANNSIPQLWDRYMKRYNSIPNKIEGACYGLCLSGDDSENFTENSEFEYLACTGVSSTKEIPEGMSIAKIPAGKYAKFEHKGPLDTLGETYKNIYSQWIPEQNLELRENIDFELYDERFNFGEEDSIMEIYIPIK